MKTPRELALLAARALSDKKGKEIRVLEIAELTTLADYFVLATGASNTQINALVDNVEKVLHEEAEEGAAAPGGLSRRHMGAAGLRLHRHPCVQSGSPRVLRPGAPVAGRQARGHQRHRRRARLRFLPVFGVFAGNQGLTIGRKAIK